MARFYSTVMVTVWKVCYCIQWSNSIIIIIIIIIITKSKKVQSR